MYNQNYGYSTSSHQQSTTLPYSSTPNVRSSRPPRFGYSGPSAYPRPRSSASKPNPDGYAESTRGPYEYPDDYVDNTKSHFEYPDDYLDNPSSKYPETSDYGNAESYSGSTMRSNYGNDCESGMNSDTRNIYGSAPDNYQSTFPRSTFGNSDDYVNNMRGTTESMMNNYSNTNNRMDVSFSSMNNTSALSQNDTAYFTCNDSFYESPKKPLISGNSLASHLPYFSNSTLSAVRRQVLQGRFPNKKDKFKATSSFGKKSKTARKRRKANKGKDTMATKTEWRCTVCSIEFTSGIPYDMHLRGARHAKKMKLQGALTSVQSQVVEGKEVASTGTSFRCDLCNITANSTLQLQTHLDGTKHKNKLQQQSNEKNPEVNGKSNGAAVVRSVPAEFGEPQAKMCKFSCDTCNISVNSDIQLQQHLTSKKHQAKVEGKPYPKKKFKSKTEGDEDETEQKMDESEPVEKMADDTAGSDDDDDNKTMQDTGETRKMVVGVKTLASSFVQGDTLH